MISARLVSDAMMLPGAVADYLVAFLTPANAMLSVELTNLANILSDAKMLPQVRSQAKNYSSRITKAIWDTTVSSEAQTVDVIL